MKLILIISFFLPLLSMGNDKELKICLTGSTEKAIPKYGEAFVNGATLAIRELSEFDKKKVTLKINFYDSNPLAPISKLKELQEEDCDAIVGFSTGNDLLSIEEPLKLSPILVISIYGDPQDRFNNTNYLRTFQPSAKDLVEHLFKQLPYKLKKENKILIVTAADRSEMVAYKEAFLNSLKDFPFVNQIEVIEQVHDLRKLKETLQKSQTWDYLILLTRSLIAAEVSDLVNTSSKPIILGTKFFGSLELPAFYNFLKNKNIEAYISRQNCTCELDSSYIKWRNRYKKEFLIEPMSISVESYDATKFILKSLKATTLNKKSIIKHLNNIDSNFKGVSSVEIGKKLKISSTKRYLIKIDKNGYKEFK